MLPPVLGRHALLEAGRLRDVDVLLQVYAHIPLLIAPQLLPSLHAPFHVGVVDVLRGVLET